MYKRQIINASNVFVSLLFSCLLFKFEKLTTRKIFGSVIGFLGVILINISGAAINGNFSFAGEGAYPLLLFIMPPGAFIALAGLIIVFNKLRGVK